MIWQRTAPGRYVSGDWIITRSGTHAGFTYWNVTKDAQWYGRKTTLAAAKALIATFTTTD